MLVTAVKTFVVDPGSAKRWLFAKVETDAGIHGWGEAYTVPDRERSIEQQIEALGRYLVGRDPHDIKHFCQVAYRDFSTKRGSMELYCAVSALEQAMWDVVGKHLGTPVYNLLGGRCRPRIRVYANGWYGGAHSPELLAARAREVVARGFTALKFDPIPGPWQPFIGPAEERAAVESVRIVREAVGPDVEILVEVHRRLSPMCAIRLGRALEQFRPFWFEEPCPADNVEHLAEVRRAIAIPTVTGEALYTKMGFREVFERQGADIINPDICNCGGILELKEIAAMAEPYLVAISPHNYNSTAIGLAASVQLCAAIPNFLILEYFVNFEAASAEIAPRALRAVGGYIELPTAPGLGVDLDETALTRRLAGATPARHIRRYEEEGP